MMAQFAWRATAFILILLALAAALPAQDPGTSPSPKPLRILFDQRGGFRVYGLDPEGSPRSLLGNATDTPFRIDLFRQGQALSLSLSEAAAEASADAPGFRGPLMVGEGVEVQLWGLDLSATNPSWSALRYELTNTSGSISTVDIHLTFDTMLGEGGREPIQLINLQDGSKQVVSDEQQIKPGAAPALVGSGRLDTGENLYLLVPGQEWSSLLPSRVVVANLRRLQDSPANFEFEEHRAFNLLPFSINDSAVAYLYESIVLLPNQRVALDILINPSPVADTAMVKALGAALAAIPLTRAPVRSAGTQPVSGKRQALVEKLNGLLATLDRLLKTDHYQQVEIERLVEAIDQTQKQLQTNP